MTICEAGEIAIVPFPFTDMAVAKPRPALVLSTQKANGESGNTIFATITTSAKNHWPTDVPLADAAAAGLTAASLVRLKLFTLDNRLVARKIGTLSPHLRAQDAERRDGGLGPAHRLCDYSAACSVGIFRVSMRRSACHRS